MKQLVGTIAVLSLSIPTATANADTAGADTCNTTSRFVGKESFSKLERRQIQRVGRVLKTSADRGATTIGALLNEARTDKRRAFALSAALGWCIAHGYDGSTSTSYDRRVERAPLATNVGAKDDGPLVDR